MQNTKDKESSLEGLHVINYFHHHWTLYKKNQTLDLLIPNLTFVTVNLFESDAIINFDLFVLFGEYGLMDLWKKIRLRSTKPIH